MDWRENQGSGSALRWQQQSRDFGRFAYKDYSEDESDRESDSGQQLCDSTLDNVEEWKWKFTMLVRNQNEQELVSRDRKDRRDFEQLSALATRMGLHSRQYGKVVVFSKVLLPNYRSDLDDKRPQREVMLPFGLLKDVDILLKRHLSQKSAKGGVSDSSISRADDILGNQEASYDQPEPPISATKERILRRKSLELCDRQQEWQDSPEGQKMLEFRRSLPAYKERDILLKAISKNQVVVISGETGCGKTTQVPQYILESEIEAARGASCNIICTQPRRISAMSVSERVAAERGEQIGESVSLSPFFLLRLSA